jgi:hypothetical protein
VFAPPDTLRPHVRLGALWFLLVLVALAGGPLGLVVPYGGAAALGAAQTARAWQRAGRPADVRAAAALAALLPLLAAYATWGPGAAILIGVAVSVAVARGDTRAILVAGGATIRSWLFIGMAAASVVVMAGMDLGAALALVLLTSAYDCGNYLVGSDSRWPGLGIAAGAAAVGVLSFSLFVVALPPFGGPGIVPFALATAVLAPLGQVAAAYVLPDGRALASGLRRLDSILLVAPAWLVMFALVPPA